MTDKVAWSQVHKPRDPEFYAAKRAIRAALGNPPLIEILRDRITVIDHDMTVHVI